MNHSIFKPHCRDSPYYPHKAFESIKWSGTSDTRTSGQSQGCSCVSNRQAHSRPL